MESTGSQRWPGLIEQTPRLPWLLTRGTVQTPFSSTWSLLGACALG